MNWKLDQSSDNHAAVIERTFDLANERPGKYLSTPSDFLRYTLFSVEVVCVECTGTSGNVTIHETNLPNGQGDGVYTTGVTVATGVNSSTYSKVTNILSNYLAVEFPATLGTVGHLTIRIVGKTQ
jgi:hypothetical protein